MKCMIDKLRRVQFQIVFYLDMNAPTYKRIMILLISTGVFKDHAPAEYPAFRERRRNRGDTLPRYIVFSKILPKGPIRRPVFKKQIVGIKGKRYFVEEAKIRFWI